MALSPSILSSNIPLPSSAVATTPLEEMLMVATAEVSIGDTNKKLNKTTHITLV
jgi:hypothetical protein